MRGKEAPVYADVFSRRVSPDLANGSPVGTLWSAAKHPPESRPHGGSPTAGVGDEGPGRAGHVGEGRADVGLERRACRAGERPRRGERAKRKERKPTA